ncbi:unnamed protein product [Ilex paraguariensis]|uniref:Uncharacterized protein n=1 Tax=Ilex paraguariensis TaxID=185542 RepID=A0ABC8QZP2_9AQUA
MKFVYRVMLLLKVSNLNKFSIKCSEFSDVSDLNAWISAALSHDVRELDLYVPLKGSGGLPNLKTLHLYSVEFSNDESIKRLFSGCPLLEDLVLLECELKNINVLNISASALKSLIISYPVMNSISKFLKYKIKMELNTPSLQYLEYIDYVAEGYATRAYIFLSKLILILSLD